LVSSQTFSSRNTAVGKARAYPLARGADKPEQSRVRLAAGGQTRLLYLPLTVTARLGYFNEEGLEADQGGLRRCAAGRHA
jgi:ABC-type nitrate/sulfonate/bicarbonate transport system substrate-binding protein